MQKLTVACPLVLSAALLMGCGDSSSHPTAPTTTFGSASASFAITPSVLTAQPVEGGGSCPEVSPFVLPFTLSVHTSTQSVTITSLAVQFTNTAGMTTIPPITMPQVTLTAPIPITQFGTALVESRSLANFPVQVPIGCGTGTTGTVVIVVGTIDGVGGRSSVTLSAPVR